MKNYKCLILEKFVYFSLKIAEGEYFRWIYTYLYTHVYFKSQMKIEQNIERSNI